MKEVERYRTQRSVTNQNAECLGPICETWAAFTFCRCNFNHVGLIHPARRIRSGWEACSTLSLLHVLFLGNPFGIFFIFNCLYISWDLISKETQASSYLVSHAYLVGACSHLQVRLCRCSSSLKYPSHVCYKWHFVVIIEFDFFVEQHLLCTQVKTGLLMRRGEHWKKAYGFGQCKSNWDC